MSSPLTPISTPNHQKRKTEQKTDFLAPSVAALKCRQRKKQWLANLQQKVELFSSENDQLSNQLASLREEVIQLKTRLLAHKDCPVSQSQAMGGYLGGIEFAGGGMQGGMMPAGMQGGMPAGMPAGMGAWEGGEGSMA